MQTKIYEQVCNKDFMDNENLTDEDRLVLSNLIKYLNYLFFGVSHHIYEINNNNEDAQKD